MKKRSKPKEGAPIEMMRIHALAAEINASEQLLSTEKAVLKSCYIDIGRMMKKIRVKEGISRNAAAEAMGVSANLIALMEKGVSNHYTTAHRTSFFTNVLKSPF